MTGTDKKIEQSSTRTSASHTRKKWAVHALLLIFGLVLAYIVGALLFNYQPPVAAFFGLSFVLLFFAAGQCLYEVGVSRTIVLFAITAIIGFGVEVLGANTGFLFGKYSYGVNLGTKVIGVPIVVPLVWFVIVFIAFSLVFPRTAGSTNPRGSPSKIRTILPLILLAAFGAVAWDFLVDPLFSSSQYGYWTWQISPSTPQLSGVPLTNFIGWFVVATGMLGIFVFLSLKYFGRNKTPSAKLIPQLNTTDSRIAYILLMIDGSVANAQLGHAAVVVIGAIAMISFLLATVKLETMRKKENGQLNS
jgi:uncharacterized membrane protein